MSCYHMGMCTVVAFDFSVKVAGERVNAALVDKTEKDSQYQVQTIPNVARSFL